MRLKVPRTTVIRSLACLAVLLLLLGLPGPRGANAQELKPFSQLRPASSVDFAKLSLKSPRFKTMVRIRFARPLTLKDLDQLASLGVLSHHGGPLEVLGTTQGIFFLRAANLPLLKNLPLTMDVEPLSHFRMSGLYRIHFKVADESYWGRISFRVSAPRDDYGKTLVHMEEVFTPGVEYRHETDRAGNRWVVASWDVTPEARELKLDFYFEYQVDLAQLLKHSLIMTPRKAPRDDIMPAEVAEMLNPGPKINSLSPQVADLAQRLFSSEERLSARQKYGRVLTHIKNNLPYDHVKRAKFFGGKMVYNSMADMYDPPDTALNRGYAACPSVSILEAALMRAGGVPARTAGRWGHFFSEVYVPGWGWQSTSPTPTGIPLLHDVDNTHLPFVSWEPEIPVQTTMWEGQVKVLD